MTSFPSWLDRATLEWAADYCRAMAVRLDDVRDVRGAVGADVCARGLRECCAGVPPQLSAQRERGRRLAAPDG
jgi:gamma-glutamyl:cysteine ligase YbdK (ATP-grasp superfamily)